MFISAAEVTLAGFEVALRLVETPSGLPGPYFDVSAAEVGLDRKPGLG